MYFSREAIEHLLTALNKQASGTTSRGEKGGMSDSMWGTLRLLIAQVGPEHMPAVENRLVTIIAISLLCFNFNLISLGHCHFSFKLPEI